jgi:histidyl-tRNA synthetase
MKYSRLRGVKDVIYPDNILWEHIIAKAYSVLKDYGFSLIITPTIEEIGLFVRGIGEGSDIVIKEMYDFMDKKGRHIALRPEGTASVVRAYIENSLPEQSDLFYMGQMFRYERPQTGRYREFFQIGAESFGDATPYKDAEMIRLAGNIIKNLGVMEYRLKINCLGAEEGYQAKLKAFLEARKADLCEDCLKKIDRAPIRVLDCKVEKCKKAVEGAPLVTDNLTPENKAAFEKIKLLLDNTGVEYKVDPAMVRGLDYYTGTVFEFTTEKLGPQQNTILAGGRYDRLVSEFGGKNTPATGFALGVERMAEVLKSQGNAAADEAAGTYIVADKNYINEGFMLVEKLRSCGIKAGMSFEGKSFKSQFREADSKKAKFVIIIGENEINTGKFSVKTMLTGTQQELSESELIAYLKV